MNLCMMMGRLTRDPVFKTGATEKGDYCVASFYLAVPRRFAKECCFIKVTAFGKNAEFARDYLTKGKKVAVRGELATGSYKDQKTGQTVNTVEINAQEIEFADKKDSGESRKPSGAQNPVNGRFSQESGNGGFPQGSGNGRPSQGSGNGGFPQESGNGRFSRGAGNGGFPQGSGNGGFAQMAGSYGFVHIPEAMEAEMPFR